MIPNGVNLKKQLPKIPMPDFLHPVMPVQVFSWRPTLNTLTNGLPQDASNNPMNDSYKLSQMQDVAD